MALAETLPSKTKEAISASNLGKVWMRKVEILIISVILEEPNGFIVFRKTRFDLTASRGAVILIWHEALKFVQANSIWSRLTLCRKLWEVAEYHLSSLWLQTRAVSVGKLVVSYQSIENCNIWNHCLLRNNNDWKSTHDESVIFQRRKSAVCNVLSHAHALTKRIGNDWT